jgi:FkbM family methyltransferase
MNFMESRMSLWKNRGFIPKVIYDIGAYRGEWAKGMKDVFPESCFYLFEANPTHIPSLKQLPFPFFIELLGDREEEVVFYSRGDSGDGVFKENTKFYRKDGKEDLVKMRTLTSVIKENHVPLPDLIKIDVQGAEKMIIDGSSDTVCSAEMILLEASILEYNEGAPTVYQMMKLMDEIDYQMLDILQIHLLPSGEAFEIDILFVKKGSSLIKRGMLI